MDIIKSRELAKLANSNNLVKVDGKCIIKPSYYFNGGVIEVSEPFKYVS